MGCHLPRSCLHRSLMDITSLYLASNIELTLVPINNSNYPDNNKVIAKSSNNKAMNSSFVLQRLMRPSTSFPIQMLSSQPNQDGKFDSNLNKNQI